MYMFIQTQQSKEENEWNYKKIYFALDEDRDKLEQLHAIDKVSKYFNYDISDIVHHDGDTKEDVSKFAHNIYQKAEAAGYEPWSYGSWSHILAIPDFECYHIKIYNKDVEQDD